MATGAFSSPCAAIWLTAGATLWRWPGPVVQERIVRDQFAHAGIGVVAVMGLPVARGMVTEDRFLAPGIEAAKTLLRQGTLGSLTDLAPLAGADR